MGALLFKWPSYFHTSEPIGKFLHPWKMCIGKHDDRNTGSGTIYANEIKNVLAVACAQCLICFISPSILKCQEQ